MVCVQSFYRLYLSKIIINMRTCFFSFPIRYSEFKFEKRVAHQVVLELLFNEVFFFNLV